MRRALAWILALASVVAMAGPAYAHARLLSSDPSGGSTVAASPKEITLRFSERIETSFGGVQIFDSSGIRVESEEPEISGSTVRVALAELPAPGNYTVVFRIISADSHPVESRFAFAYQPPPPEPAPTATTPEAPPASPGQAPTPLNIRLQAAGPGSSAGLWTARLLNYLALTIVVGLLLTAGILLKGEGAMSEHQRRAMSLAVWAATVLLLSGLALFVLGLSVAAALPLPRAFRGELAGRFAETRFGLAVLVQASLGLLIAILALIARRRGSRRLVLAALTVAAAAAVAPGWWGHAGTARVSALAMLSDWLHLISVTAWVGGLVALAAFVLRPSSGIEPAGPAQRFSMIAGRAVGVVLFTGTANALMRIGTFEELFSTKWGRLVLIKLGLFAAIAALGWRNRNRMLPRIAREGGEARKAFRSLILAEVAVMTLAFGAATALASTIPSDAEAASRIQAVATAFADGQINMTVDPAAVGDNLIHLYFLDRTGRPMPVADASLIFQSPKEKIEAKLLDSGPGHYTVLSQRFDRAGDYQVVVSATLEGRAQTATGVITVR